MKTNHFILVILFFIVSFCNSQTTYTWTGNGGDTNWFNTSNWDIGSVPTSNVLTIIPTNFFVEIKDDSAFSGSIQLLGDATLSIENNLTLNQSLSTSSETTIVWKKGVYKGGLNVNGLLKIESFETKEFDNAFINNYGTIIVENSGVIHLNEVTIINSSDAVISIKSGGGIIEQGGEAILKNEGLIEMPDDEMSRAFYMVFDLNNTGVINVGENQIFLFLVDSQNLNNMETGRLEGKGVYDITANFTNSGIFSPAGINSIGTLEVVNNFSFSVDAELEVEIEGPNEGEYDRIAVTGFPSIGGNIKIDLKYAPILGEEFIVITANEITSCDLPEYLTAIFEGEEFYFEVICENTLVKLRVVEEVLDLGEFTTEGNHIQVLPNPITEDYKVILNSEYSTDKNLSVELYNYLGQKVKSQDMTSSEINLQKGNLTSGLYLLLLKEGNNIIEKKKLIFE